MYISDSTGMHSACYAIFKRLVFRVLKVEFILLFLIVSVSPTQENDMTFDLLYLAVE